MIEISKITICIPVSREQLFPLQNQFVNNQFSGSDKKNNVTWISQSKDTQKNGDVIRARECLFVPINYNYAGNCPHIDFFRPLTPYFLRKGEIKYIDDTRLSLAELNDIVVNIEDVFEELYKQWREKTKFDSFIGNSTDIYHERIVQLGYGAVPFIIKKLKTEHAHLFIALNRITGENPVKKENMGNVRKMSEDWIQWWEERKNDMGR